MRVLKNKVREERNLFNWGYGIQRIGHQVSKSRKGYEFRVGLVDLGDMFGQIDDVSIMVDSSLTTADWTNLTKHREFIFKY